HHRPHQNRVAAGPAGATPLRRPHGQGGRMSIIPPAEKKPQPHHKALPPLFDLQKVRNDFPILDRKAHGKPLVYFDNAATTQKPQAVINATSRYYELYNANIHRAVHLLSTLATEEYDEARKKVQRFLNAPSKEEVIFTRGTTEGINLVAQTYGRANV